MTSRARKRGTRAYDARMFAMADRLFDDFSSAPVGQVFRAIAAARAVLGEEGDRLPEPEAVEALARASLTGSEPMNTATEPYPTGEGAAG